jgi:hypothetical protein
MEGGGAEGKAVALQRVVIKWQPLAKFVICVGGSLRGKIRNREYVELIEGKSRQGKE